MTPELVQAVAKIARHCWRGTHWVKTPKGPRHVKEPLKFPHLQSHVNGGPGIGLAPIVPGESTTRIAVLDFDSHKGDVPWDEMVRVALTVDRALRERGLEPIAFRSSGGKGVHLIALWDEPQDAYSVRELLATALTHCGLKSGTKGVKNQQVEIFPKQDAVEAGDFGSMFVLPLTGESLPLDSHTLDLKDYEYAEGMREWPKSKPVPVCARPERSTHTIQIPPNSNLADVRAALAAIPNEGNESLDYDSWRDVIFAVHHATDGSADGLALAIEFSQRSPKCDLEFLENRVWPYIKSERGGSLITAATLFNRARQHGWNDDVLAEFEDLGVLEEPVPADSESQESAAGASSPATATGAAQRFPVHPLHVFAQRKSPPWIVRHVLPQAELALIIGESGAGKSFLAFDLAAAIARGEAWRGFRTRAGKVIYIVAEGAAYFQQRVVAYGRHHELELSALQIGVISDTPNLMLKEDVGSIVKQVKSFGKVDVIIVDTFAQATPGANENAAEDMGRALANCKALHRATGALIVLIHHVGKDETKGARGWSGIKAAADAEMTIARKDALRTITLSKLKDGADGLVLPFKLVDVEIGKDDEGEVLKSCVVEHIDEAGSEARRARQPSGDVAKQVWQTASALAALDPEITVGDVIEESIKEMVTDPAKRDRRREVVTRALQGLASSGWLRVEGGRVLVPA